MQECRLEGVTGIRCSENLVPLWEEGLVARLADLRALLMDTCALTAIPTGEASLIAARKESLMLCLA